MSKGSIILFDEEFSVGPLAEVLRASGYETKIIEPVSTVKPEHLLIPDNLSAVIYESYFAMTYHREYMRPTLDKLIDESRRNNSKLIVLTTQEETQVNEEGFMIGVHYDYFIQKPQRPEEIIRILGIK